MDDLQAIVDYGGITTAEFPALERDLDYVTNYFLPYPTGPLVESTIETEHGASATVLIEIEHSTPWDIESASIVNAAVVLSGVQVWEIVSEAALAVSVDLTHEASFEIAHDVQAISEFLLRSDAIWTALSDGQTTVSVDLEQNHALTVQSVSEVAVLTDVRHAGTIEFTLEALAETPIVVHHEATFSVTSQTTVWIDAQLRVNSTFEMWHYSRLNGVNSFEDLPIWPFEPNWSEGMLQSLEWLTDVMRSPTGAEQRRSLRAFPRRTFEFSVALKGQERSYFDNLIAKNGARDWYLPLWHDAHHIERTVNAGSQFFFCATGATALRAGDYILITSDSAFKHEIAEVDAVNSLGVLTVAPLTSTWGADTRIYRVQKARLTDQPRPRRYSDDTLTSQIRFRIAERNDDFVPAFGEDVYRSFPVLAVDADERETLDYGYERIVEEIDNLVGIPSRYDSAGISFPSQRHAWTLNGRDEYARFMGTIYALRGKAKPIWLPTFFNDFEMAVDAAPSATALTVKNVGFTTLGGPNEQRQDIMIQKVDGTLIYRRIVAAATSGADHEVIGLDAPLVDGLAMKDVARISFLSLSRLDQDTIEISHKTDVNGAATVSATFRNTPDLRQPNVGF